MAHGVAGPERLFTWPYLTAHLLKGRLHWDALAAAAQTAMAAYRVGWHFAAENDGYFAAAIGCLDVGPNAASVMHGAAVLFEALPQIDGDRHLCDHASRPAPVNPEELAATRGKGVMA